MNSKLGSGIIVPLLTPINEDESINYAQLAALIEHVIAGGVDVIFIMGSTGEFARFDTQTRAKVIEETVGVVAGRVPVYAGVADTGLSTVVRNVELAEKAGADVVVTTLPYYYPIYNDDEAYSFFRDVTSATSLPVVLYEIPSTIGASISFEVIDKLFSTKNVIGIKDSSGDFPRLRETIKRYKNAGKDFSITMGSESLCYEGFTAGADGIVPSLANPFPKLLANIYRASLAKDNLKLKELCGVMDSMNKLNTHCDAWMSPNVWRKKALSHMGICNEYCTRPYVPVDEALDLEIIEVIKQYQKMYP